MRVLTVTSKELTPPPPPYCNLKVKKKRILKLVDLNLKDTK